MKKVKIISALLLLSLVLISCNKVEHSSVNTNENNTAQEEQITSENDETQKDEQASIKTEQNESTIEENNTELPDPPVENIYTMVDKKYDNYGLHITYPQITNMNDKDKQNKINEMIKSEALTTLMFYDNGDGTSRIKDANWDIKYKITFEGKNVLSLIFTGDENDKGLNHPIAYLYTLNIDMNNCKKIKLSDLVNIDEKFIDNIKNYRISEPGHNGIGNRAFKFYMDVHSTEDLLDYFKNSDLSYKNSSYTFSYITKDYLVISTDIQHSMGDYLEIKLKYKDIKDNIKSDNKIWDGLLDNSK